MKPLASNFVLQRIFVVVFVLLVALVAPGEPSALQTLDLRGFPRNDLDDFAESYRVWVEQEVRWIITDEERDIFLRLDTDLKRDRFIEAFWKQRDPTLGTPKNEYRELHYERIKEANRLYGGVTTRPGWRTDRGWMHILLGKPTRVSNRANSDIAYPLETWFYHADPRLNIPAFFYLIFFRDKGRGDYRLFSPTMDGPMALLNPAGETVARTPRRRRGPRGGGSPMPFEEEQNTYLALNMVDPELGGAAFSLIPGDGAGFGAPSLSSELLISQIASIPKLIMPNAGWAHPILAGVTETEVRFATLEINAQAFGLLDPSGEPFAHFAVRADGSSLNLQEYDGAYYLTFELGAALKDLNQRVLSDTGTELLESELNADTAQNARRGQVLYTDRLAAVPGVSSLDLLFENNVSNQYAHVELDLWLPQAHPERVTSTRPFLNSEVNRLGSNYDPFGNHLPFQIANLSLEPAFDGPYASGARVYVFHQLLLPERYLTAVRATYTLVDPDGTPLHRRASILQPGLADTHGVINQLAEIELVDVPPGDYQLLVDIDSDESGAFVLPLRVVAVEGARDLFRYGQAQPPANDTTILLKRARQYRVLGETDAAISVLDGLLAREPESREAIDLQLQLLTDASQFGRLTTLVAPMLTKEPHDISLLVAAAAASASLDNHFDAIRYYERARLAMQANIPRILNPLASSYYADGQLDKAAETLEASLAVDSEQPRIRELLELLRTR